MKFCPFLLLINFKHVDAVADVEGARPGCRGRPTLHGLSISGLASALGLGGGSPERLWNNLAT